MSLYLIAVLPPEQVDVEVRKWKEYMLEKFNCRVALKSPAHITLIPPFTLRDDEKRALEMLLNNFAAEESTFVVQLNDFSAFAPRVIYVHVSENPALSVLKTKLEELLIKENYPVKKEHRPFHPHVTIANRDLKKPDFPLAWQHFKSLSYQTSFPVESITLLKHNGQTWDRVHDAILPRI